MRLLGFGSLILICEVLLDRDCDNDTKLKLIYINAVWRCYLFLFIIRLCTIGIIFSKHLWWMYLILLACYLVMSFLTPPDDFYEAVDEWHKKGEISLYEVRDIIRCMID